MLRQMVEENLFMINDLTNAWPTIITIAFFYKQFLSGSFRLEPLPLPTSLLPAHCCQEGGADVSKLPQPESDADTAVKDFNTFLANNNIKA